MEFIQKVTGSVFVAFDIAVLIKMSENPKFWRSVKVDHAIMI